MSIVAAVDIGGTKIAVGLVDSAGQVLEQEVRPTEADKGFDYGLQQICGMMALCRDRRPQAKVLGVGIGCTGPVDPNSGVLGPNSFLPKWEGKSLINHLEGLLSLPVAIENDADAAALGEFTWGVGKGTTRCLYVTVSTGIGCGLVMDGKLYRGAGGAHPELGHMIIDHASGPQCFCGARGCWESLASGPALAGWYKTQIAERRLPDPGQLDARNVCLRAGQEDALAQEAILREGFYLGMGLANLVTAFVPDVIVLGGGVMQSWPLFEGSARAIIRQSCGLVPFERTALRLASLGARTGLAGAARVWFHRFAEVGSEPV